MENWNSKTWNGKGELLGAMAVPIAASLIARMVSSFLQAVAFSLINSISKKGVMRAEKRQNVGFLRY